MSGDDLEFRRENLRNQWRISEECGNPPSEADKVRDMVLLEMKFACSNLPRCLSVAKYASDWVSTRNPFHIDAAVYLCSLDGCTPPPALAEQVAAVAKARLFGHSRAGTAEQIFKDNARAYAMTLMAKLCAAGATVESSASKVAQQLASQTGSPVFKASSLERYYARAGRDIERDMRKDFADDPVHLAEWQATIEEMAEACDDLKGDRR